MRKHLLCLLLSVFIVLLNQLQAQTSYVENFQNTPVGSIPTGWVVSSNTDVAQYGTPLDNCGAGNRGMQTPGVGKSAPMKMILPALTFSNSNPNITIDFSVFVLDATLKCNSMKDFPCPTYVKAYLVKSTYTSVNSDPTAADIYVSQPDYQILNANANNTIVFPNAPIPNGGTYRLLLDFKTVDSKCQSGNTKFVFDDFGIVTSNCPATGCVPTANDDFFSADFQSFTQSVSGNVFGGFALWANSINIAYKLQSLDMAPAVNAGLDKDDNNPALSTMLYTLVSGPKIEATAGCPSPTPGPGTLTFFPNGTFTYTNSNPCIYMVSFTYKVSNGKNTSRIAKVTIKMPTPSGIPLPVTLVNFNAQRNKEKVLLTWQTAMEANNSGFDVQRKLGNGEWKTIAFIFSKADGGNNHGLLSYEYTDINMTNGTTQYRLRQVDVDTRSIVSEVRSVRGASTSGQLVVYPNPSSDGNVNLVFEDRNAARTISIADMTGRIVKHYQHISTSSLQVTSLQDGIYTLHITNENTAETVVEKVIVKKR